MTIAMFCLLCTMVTLLCIIMRIMQGAISKQQQWIEIFFFVIIVALISAYRPLDMSDTGDYEYLYRNIGNVDFNNLGLFARIILHGGARSDYINVEVGFCLLMRYASYMGLSFRLFSFSLSIVISLVTLMGLFNISKYLQKESIDRITILNAYLLFDCFRATSVTIRAGISIAFCLVAIGNLLQKKGLTISAVSFILAVYLHNASVLIIPIATLLLLHISISKRTFMCIWLISMMVMLLNLSQRIYPLFMEVIISTLKFSGIEKFVLSAGNTRLFVPIRHLVLNFFAGFVALFTYTNEKRNATMSFIVLCGIVLFALGYPMKSSYRITEYFFLFLIPLFSYRTSKRCGMIYKNTFVALIGCLGLFFIQIYSGIQ